MTVQITIIGMGQIGTSIGLALASQKGQVMRVGHDRDLGTARLAEKMGALDRVEINLPNAVREADLVILSLPLDQVRETLAVINQDLKDNAVVVDTAPVKEVVAQWAKELLPAGRHYVGLTPVINPAYLEDHDYGAQAAHADLFKNGLIVIVAGPPAASEAIKLVADLARLLGSSALFAEAVEVDSLMSATHILPQLMAAALVNTTVDQPGWREGRKLAGRAYSEVTGTLALLGEPAALASSALLAQDNILRVIDNAMAYLQQLRNDIQAKDNDALIGRLEQARRGRDHWWKERQQGNWAAEEIPHSPEIPKASEMFKRLVWFGSKTPQPKKKDEKD